MNVDPLTLLDDLRDDPFGVIIALRLTPGAVTPEALGAPVRVFLQGTSADSQEGPLFAVDIGLVELHETLSKLGFGRPQDVHAACGGSETQHCDHTPVFQQD